MKRSFLLLLFVYVGCSRQPKAPVVHISLIDNKRSLKFSGFDAAVIGEIGRDTLSNIWQSLIPVYRMPADTDMKNFQRPQPGRYRVQDSVVIFTPDTPFIKQQTYFVRYYRFQQDTKAVDYLRSGKKLGSQPFIDLIFKQ